MATAHQQDEYSRLLAGHRAQLYGYILALVLRNEDADDVFQQAAIVMWQKFDEFDPSTSFLSWACRIAYFEAKNFIRKQRNARLEPMTELLDAFAADQYVGQLSAERESALQRCLGKLNRADRKLLDDVYREGLSVTSAAELYGRTRRSVSNSLARIRRSLLVCIERTLAMEGAG